MDVEETSTCHDVAVFLYLSVRELLSSDAMKEYNRARVYLDENYKSQEHFTVSDGKVLYLVTWSWPFRLNVFLRFGICFGVVTRTF